MTDSQGVWMTQETKDRLLAELAELSEPHIGSGTADISEQQSRQARIHQIHDLLAVAVVGEDPPDDGVAEPGMVLTVRYDDGDTETFLLGVRDDDQSGLEVYSPQSPLGKAITGARRGEERSYQVPSGASVTVTLLDAVPFGLHKTQHPA
ncbi:MULTISPECIES: GreA/GreB family elongation factor [Mycobacteriaceae]|uniref:Transcription elongation factor GreA n=4 Tax=Mycobacteriaceae TaxID=1762 RepID=F5YZE6_MYCSD|nr:MULTISPECIES: GreA/GreB family elongation factor [Mycobacteriaceae]AEF36810.1 transcription elongation factor GreA [Mycolicibacter sinensis]OQZ99473.1 transcription elongation factor GreAB [Mycolicibacter algericus DSM 45454]RAU99907.1 transcription elongation factor GreAB [Mycolicibacter senuensis]BBX14157.1 transcription elongation factor GreA [Mycobacterium novum]GFG85919.1 transcription elongation factor GreA [Mycolicibacter algericus]